MATQPIILVAVDFEAASLGALALARELAQPLGAEVVLLHVAQLPIYTYPGFEPAVLPGAFQEVTAAAKRALDELAVKHGNLRTVLREGDAANEILTAVEELQPRMVVVGSHGRRGLAHLLLGSVAEKIVRRATVPVVTVRAEEPAKA